ncbi:MAG: hypothetical protein K2N48_05270 [Muribaculaceae bacterium]|nr:hypothetical protein [Muribaculaceae bacterium]
MGKFLSDRSNRDKIDFVLSLLITLIGCIYPGSTRGQVIISLDSTKVISQGYVGNGVQWDPYQLDYGHGLLELSDADIAKLYTRLDFMQPGLIRMMINATSLVSSDGTPDFKKYYRNLEPLLNYCQSRDIDVVFGDWGGSVVDRRTKHIHKKNIENIITFVRYLREEKGMDCIRYFNFVNEPNGYWSSTDGDFSLWAKGIKETYAVMKREGIASKVRLIGPDAAIWTKDETWWVERSANELGDMIGLYDIHTYPSRYTVSTNQYYDIIKAYRDYVPKGRKIIMGEIGLKYVAPEDKHLNELNQNRAKSALFASLDDSQMSVYDFSYGIDMADALIQTIRAGYSGTVAWMLDDAMHSKEAPDKLKIWGFWNIFGDEFFGAEQEKVRPWFYAWSMLCRAIPSGCDILKSDSDTPLSIKCAFTRKAGKYSIILLNITNSAADVCLKGAPSHSAKDVKTIIYSENSLNNIETELSMPEDRGTLFPDTDEIINVPANSLIIISNII